MADTTEKLRCRLRRESGFALPLALGVCVVLAIAGTSAMIYTASNFNSANRSKAEQMALSLAEAGLNYAYATLHNASNPSMPDAVPERTVALEGGSTTYSGTMSGSTWTLTGVGRAAAGTDEVVRTVRGRVSLGSARRGTSNNAVWNYVYADSIATCTSLGNSANVNVPLYVRGNLCMNNTARVTGHALQVGGTLTINQSATVGAPDAHIAEAHIAGGCRLNGGDLHNPCSSADRVHADRISSTPTGLTKPPVNMAEWYQNAKPGPMHGCTSGSFPGGFDTGDGVMNGSRGSVDLMPGTAYDCTVRDGAGAVAGRIAWTPGAPGRLELEGTIFFDGNIDIGGNATGYYVGRGTIYASGSVTLGQQSALCGVPACDATWNATQNLLAFVGGATPTSVTIGNYSKFQGAVYAVGDYREGNNSTFWGPIIADQIHLQNSTTNHYVPIGTLMPGMPANYEEAVTLTNEPGSWSN